MHLRLHAGFLGGLVGIAGAGRALASTLIASAPLFSLSAVNMQCELTNASSRPVVVVSAKVLDDDGLDVTAFENCTRQALAPGAVCVFTSPASDTVSSTHGTAAIGGSARAVRGQCALFDGSGQVLSTPLQ
jgi:hypothetical protein